MNVLFIGGASRSGSTLLDRMFGSEPNVASLGEVHHIWQRGFIENHLCGCGKNFHDCPKWAEVVIRLSAGREPVAFAEEALGLQRAAVRSRRIPAMAYSGASRPAEEEEYASLLEELYAVASDVFQAEVIVDSSKRPSHGYLLARADLRLSVIHLVRDSRAVAHSSAKRKRKTDAAGATQLMHTQSPLQSSRGWIQQNLLVETLLKRVSRSTLMRYEDLVQDPKSMLTEVGTQFGTSMTLDWLQNNTATFSTAHTISGNPMRLDSGEVRIALDDAWRRSLNRRDRYTVTALTWPLLKRYGYV